MAARLPQPPGNGLAWLLLINGLFWGGLFGSEALLHRLLPRQSALPSPPPLGEPHPAPSPDQAAIVLPAPLNPAVHRLPSSPPPAAQPPAAPPPLPSLAEMLAALPLAEPPPQERLVQRLAQQLSGADALGGEITLANLGEPRMLPAARAERLRWQRSGDALAPLPQHWQQRLRRELAAATEAAPLERAELVRVPVRQLQQPEEVAVLIDDAGSAQALNTPLQPPVREAVEQWASRQQPAEQGRLRAVVIAADPLPAAFSPAPPPAEPAGP